MEVLKPFFGDNIIKRELYENPSYVRQTCNKMMDDVFQKLFQKLFDCVSSNT